MSDDSLSCDSLITYCECGLFCSDDMFCYGSLFHHFLYCSSPCLVSFSRPSARHFFTESERQSIVGDVVEHLRDPRTGYAFVPCLANLGLLELFPLHNPRALNGVMRLHHANPGSPAATKAVAGYFGSEIALYFSWLAHYNSSLVLPALVGVLLYWFSTSAYTSPSAFVFSVFFFLLWTIVMLEQWKRRQSEVAFDLEVADSEDKEAFLAPRPAFIGNLHQNPRTGEFDLRYPKSRRRCKYLATIPTVLGLTGLTCYGTMVFLRLSDQFTAWVEATDTVLWIPSAKPLLVLLPTLVYSVAVPVFNGLYTNVATKLTDWENYREKSDYESSLAVKLFLFYFVNSYSALFYLAFIAQDIDRLRTYLASLLVTSQFMGQVLEVGTPILQYYLNVASYVKQIRTKLASEPEGPSSSSAPFSPPSTFTPSGIKIARARRTPHAANANANGDTHGAGATGAAAGDSKNNTNVSTSSASHSSAARRSSGLLMNLPSLLRKSSAAIFGSPSKMAGEEDAGDVKNPSAGQAGGLKAKAGDASGTGNSSEKEEGEEDEVEEEEEEEEKREVRIDHVLREAQLAGRVSLFDEHIELVIQLGYGVFSILYCIVHYMVFYLSFRLSPSAFTNYLYILLTFCMSVFSLPCIYVQCACSVGRGPWLPCLLCSTTLSRSGPTLSSSRSRRAGPSVWRLPPSAYGTRFSAPSPLRVSSPTAHSSRSI